MKYHRHMNFGHRRKYIVRMRLLFTFMALVILATSAYAYHAFLTQKVVNSQQPATSAKTSSYYSGSAHVIKAPYFQFQANKSWSQVPAESTPEKFVYRSMRTNLIEHELVIYVNDIPESLAANRVMAVDKRGGSQLAPISVSEHCMKTAGGSRIDDPLVTILKSQFRCDADSTNYEVLVGMVGGNNKLSLQRPDGTEAIYAIKYTNVKATPEASVLYDILSSFQTR